MSFSYHVKSEPYNIALRDDITNKSIQFRGYGLSLVLSSNFNDLDDKDEFKEEGKFYGCMGIFYAGNDEPYLVLITNVDRISTKKEDRLKKRRASLEDPHHFHICFVTECVLISLWNFNQKHEDAESFESIFSQDNESTYYFAVCCHSNLPFDLSSSHKFRPECDNRFVWNRALRQPLNSYGPEVEKWLVFLLRGCAITKKSQRFTNSSRKYAAFILKVAFPISERSDCSFDDRNCVDTFEVEHIVWKKHKIASFVASSGSFQIDWETGDNKTIRFPKAFASSLLNHYKYMKLLRQWYHKIEVLNLFSGEFTNGYDLYEACRGPEVQRENNIPWCGSDQVHYDYFFKTVSIDKGDLDKALSNKLSLPNLDISISDENGFINKQTTLIHLTLIGEMELLIKSYQILSKEFVPKLMMKGLGLKKIDWLTEFLEESWSKTINKIYSINSEWRSFLLDKDKCRVPNSIKLFLAKSYSSTETRLSGEFRDSNCMLPEIILKDLNDEFGDFTQECFSVASNVVIRVKNTKDFEQYILDEKTNLINLIRNQQLDHSSIELMAPFQSIEMSDIINYSDILAIGVICPEYSNEFIDPESSNDDIPQLILTTLCQSESMQEFSLLYTAEYLNVNLIIFVKNSLFPHISEPSSIAGVIKHHQTKLFPAVAIRFCVHGNSVNFLCSHFPCLPKNEAFDVNRTDFSAQLMNILQFESFDKSILIGNHDYVFWFGSLFYPIHADKGANEALHAYDWEKLSMFDELYQQIKSKPAGKQGLAMFNEMPIRFPVDMQSNCFSERSLYKVNCNSCCVPLKVVENGYDADHQNSYSLMRSSYKFLTFKVDYRKRSHLIRSKLEKMNGPCDATVEVTLPIAVGSSKESNNLLSKLEKAVKESNFSPIAKHKNYTKAWFRFRDSKIAQEVQSQFNRQEIDDHFIEINYRSPRLSDLYQTHQNIKAPENLFENAVFNDIMIKMIKYVGRNYNQKLEENPHPTLNSQGLPAPQIPRRRRSSLGPIIAIPLCIAPPRRAQQPQILDCNVLTNALKNKPDLRFLSVPVGDDDDDGSLTPEYATMENRDSKPASTSKVGDHPGSFTQLSSGSLTPNYRTMVNASDESRSILENMYRGDDCQNRFFNCSTSEPSEQPPSLLDLSLDNKEVIYDDISRYN